MPITKCKIHLAEIKRIQEQNNTCSIACDRWLIKQELYIYTECNDANKLTNYLHDLWNNNAAKIVAWLS